MKRILALSIAMLSTIGCSAVKDAGNTAVDTLTHPPQELLEFLKEAFQWLLAIAVNFFSDLGNPLWKALGL